MGGFCQEQWTTDLQARLWSHLKTNMDPLDSFEATICKIEGAISSSVLTSFRPLRSAICITAEGKLGFKLRDYGPTEG